VSTPGAGYDEIGSRTRQAWLRTSLGAMAVTLLVLRGLALADAPAWVMIACLVPGIVVVMLAILRSVRLQHGESESMPGRMTVGLAMSVAALALLAGAGAAAGLVAR
jgi:amino acid permease